MPTDSPVLLPMPRHFTRRDGTSSATEPTVRIDAAVAKPQGYRLTITPDAITLIGHDDAGLFYGRQTLSQLARVGLPCCELEDWPDFPNRGVMLDVSRDKVPTMATLLAIVDELSSWKVNQLQLYTEHTFAFANHETVWRDASPITAAEIREIDAYCRERFIELVPNQNSFGHMERWLRHERYRDLAECPDGAVWWHKHRPPATLNPLDPQSLDLVRELHAELLPNFTSTQFNVGCDETMELGLGRSKAECERVGRERVYLDFLKKIYEGVRGHGHTMQFWGDIILHSPHLIDELPKDIIALEWGYEANHPFEDHCAAFAKSGVPHYVCPGTSSWCSIAGRTQNMLDNIRLSAAAGLKHGAIGFLNTDWGDLGHWQYWPISYAGLAYGAGVSWCAETNVDADLAAQLDVHVFRDASRVMGNVALDLGRVNVAMGDVGRHNSTLLFWLARKDDDRPATLTNAVLLKDVKRKRFDEAAAAIEAAIAPLASATMDRPDAQLIRDEFANAAALMRDAVAIGRATYDGGEAHVAPAHVAEHRRLWLARNRPGGLEDGAGRFA